MTEPTSDRAAPHAGRPIDLVLISGISGSGKSVALHALEDAGYYCVDNLPVELLHELVRVSRARGVSLMAVAVDVRSASSLPALLPALDRLRAEGVSVMSVFVNASTTTLVKRFSETRRPHPLTKPGAGGDAHRVLFDAIEMERRMLDALRERSAELDTTDLRPSQLRLWVRDLVGAVTSRLTLVFESFAYKRGVPLDADLVFDVRVLPNPYYVAELRPLTGLDAPVAAYLAAQPDVDDMLDMIDAFLRRWLPSFEDDQRSHLTVCIGCTGGQHRSVYLVEQLAQRFATSVATLTRHREQRAVGGW